MWVENMKILFFKGVSIFIGLSILTSCSVDRLYQMRQRQRVYALEQYKFSDLLNTYLLKEKTSAGTIEGIYSVSSIVSKKGKGLLASEEKEKVTDRKENYSRVAIIRNMSGGQREYVEISLDKEYTPSQSVVGEFSKLADGNVLVYHHFEPRGKTSSFTFSFDAAHDILEGIRTENNGNTVITYRLTYLKLSPKSLR